MSRSRNRTRVTQWASKFEMSAWGWHGWNCNRITITCSKYTQIIIIYLFIITLPSVSMEAEHKTIRINSAFCQMHEIRQQQKWIGIMKTKWKKRNPRTSSIGSNSIKCQIEFKVIFFARILIEPPVLFRSSNSYISFGGDERTRKRKKKLNYKKYLFDFASAIVRVMYMRE